LGRPDADPRAHRLPHRRHIRQTSYLAGVELDHAQDILADLMSAEACRLRLGPIVVIQTARDVDDVVTCGTKEIS
jgi:hypothetical protein